MADGQVEVDILGNTSDFDKAVDGLTDTVSAKTIALGNVLADLAKKAISSLTGAVSDAIDTGMSFEKSMSNVTALQQAAGATADDIARLKQAAEQYGASTQFTMTACSDALSYMALANWDAQKSIEALPGVLNLAAAADMDLAKASDMVTDYMSAFSKSVNDFTGEALTAVEFSDKLAYAQANSNTNAMQLGEAFKNCAANLNAAGQQMDTVTALLGTMANQGKKGSEAGTAMSAIMRDLTNAMEDGAISINGTRIAIADSYGDYRDLIDIMAEIESATNGMGETERAAALSAAFTSDSIAGLNLILNAGTEEVRKLEAGLSDCEGAAENMAATINDNLKGDLTYMESALDAVKNSVFEGINPALRSLVQLVTNDVAPNLNLLVKGLVGAASGVVGAGSQIRDAVGGIADALKNTLMNALQALPDIFKAGLSFKDVFLKSLAELLPALLPALTEAVYEMCSSLIAGVPVMIRAAKTLLDGIAEAVHGMDFAGMLTDLISILVSNLKIGTSLLVKTAISLFGSIVEALPAMLEGGAQIMTALLEAITELSPELLSLGMQLLQAIFSGIVSALPLLAEAAQRFLTSLVGYIGENLPLLITAAIGLLNMLIGLLVENLPLLVSVAVNILLALTEALIDCAPLLLDAALQLLLGLCQCLVDNLDLLIEAAFEILNALTSAIAELAPMLYDCAILLIQKLSEFITDDENRVLLIECAEAILQALIDGIGAAAASIWLGLEKLWSAMWDWFWSKDWGQIGEEILNGIAAGLSAGVVNAMDTISNIKDNFVDAFKDVFGIHSPSRLMRDEIGKFLLPGVSVGMEATSDETAADIQNALDDMLNSIDMDGIQMRLNTAVQMQGAVAVPAGFTANIRRESAEAEALSSPTDTKTPVLSPTFNVQIGNEEIRDFVVTVIDQENAVTGGNAF